MPQAAAPLGMGSRKYPTKEEEASGNSHKPSNQYQPIEPATPTNPPAIPARTPLRQLTPSIRQAQTSPTDKAGTNVSSSSSHQRKMSRKK